MATTPAIVLGTQGQLLQAEPSKVAMQAIGLAKHYYAQGKFEKAAELFMEAYKLDARVEFMFNAARAYQRAIKLSKSLGVKHYLPNQGGSPRGEGKKFSLVVFTCFIFRVKVDLQTPIAFHLCLNIWVFMLC